MRIAAAASLLLTIATGTISPQVRAKTHAEPELKWGPAPAIFPPGAQMAVLQGDPGGTAPFSPCVCAFPTGTGFHRTCIPLTRTSP